LWLLGETVCLQEFTDKKSLSREMVFRGARLASVVLVLLGVVQVVAVR